MRHGARVMGLSLLALPALFGVLATIDPGCSSSRQQVDVSTPAPDTEAALVASGSGVASEVARVARVWWREDSDKSAEPFVSDRPGGAALPGKWRSWYFCGDDGVPSGLFSDPASQAPSRPATSEEYQFHWITVDRDGETWWCFTDSGSSLGASCAQEAKRFVGRWRHGDGKTEIVLELSEDGTGRGSDSSTWEWTAAERGLELRQQCGDHAWQVTAFIMDADLRGYTGRHEKNLVGTRLDGAPNGR